jgi:hypothetical protein
VLAQHVFCVDYFAGKGPVRSFLKKQKRSFGNILALNHHDVIYGKSLFTPTK